MVSVSDGILHGGVKVLQRLKVFHFGVFDTVRIATGALCGASGTVSSVRDWHSLKFYSAIRKACFRVKLPSSINDAMHNLTGYATKTATT